MSPDPRGAELLAECAELARLGAAFVREAVAAGHRERPAADSKSTSTDLVTEVDRACERMLRAELARRRPDDAILGEEAGSTGGRSGVRWLLDPIDGTVNFVLGIPYYGVSVAAEVAGTVVAGAVADPERGEVFTASLGGGAWVDGRRLTGPRRVALDRAVVATGFNYDRGVRARQAQVAAALLPRIGDIRRLGAASLDLCSLAAGRIDGYYEAGLNLWDHAAGGLVAAEAGCVRTGLRGRAVGIRMYAAAAEPLATDLFALLEDLAADDVLAD